MASKWCITAPCRHAKAQFVRAVSLPTGVAAQVQSMTKTRRVSANRVLVELIEDGMEAQKRKQHLPTRAKIASSV
jgi:hypothetical protein